MKFRTRVLGCILTVVILIIVVRNLLSSRDSGASSSGGWLEPNLYELGDNVELIVNKVESDLTQFPYAYYDLPFTCPPTINKKPLHLSLDEIIRGDRKWQSDYILNFGQDVHCEVLCARQTSQLGMQKAKELVEKGYVVQWLIDDELPAGTTFISTIDHKKYYASGFPLGFVDPETEKTYLNNHVMMVIRYNVIDSNKHTIVGFEIYPRSVSDYHCPGASKNYEQYEIVVPVDKEENTYIPFTYSVYWREEFNVDWSNRWNFFLNSGELSEGSSVKFHWMSLANSIGIVLLVSFIVIVNLVKTLKIGKLGESDEFELPLDDKENSDSIYAVAKAWLSNDSSSTSLNILIIFTSMGVQFLFTILGSLTVSCSLNKLHNIRNSVLTMALLFFVIGAFMASFVGTWLNIDNHGNNSDNAVFYYSPFFAILCGSALPGLVMMSTLILNSIIWAKDSTHALPFGTIVLVISIYFIICIPLSLMGGSASSRLYQKYRHSLPFTSSTISSTSSLYFNRNATNKFKRPVGSKSNRAIINFRKRLTFEIASILIGGLFPFIIIHVELQFVYKSVWLEKTTFYYFYGFLFANILLLCIVICEISLLGCYVMMRMNKRDRTYQSDNWKWSCFMIGTGCAWYMEFYSLYYIFRVLQIRGFSSIFISVCYSAIFNIMCGCAMGSLAHLTSCWFVNRVYCTKYTKS